MGEKVFTWRVKKYRWEEVFTWRVKKYRWGRRFLHGELRSIDGGESFYMES